MKNNRKQRGAYNEVSFRMVFLLVFLMTTVTGFAQNKTVSGIVVDKAGEAVIGASVLVKGTSNGTITDFDGKYSLEVTSGKVQFSYIGYETEALTITKSGVYDVKLTSDNEQLDEIVVIGYGTQKKESLKSIKMISLL
mgnify:CR=1 FL=1